MAVTIESVRFGSLEVQQAAIVEFPLGLIGLPGRRYAFVDPTPESALRWLHSCEDPALALPVLDLRTVQREIVLSMGIEEEQRIGAENLARAEVYATVRATPDPQQSTVNLRAPLVIWEGVGHQVINTAPGAELRASLAELARGPAPVVADTA